MVSALLAAALAFTPADAKLAYDTARSLVREHTPRDAGTPRAAAAANHLLNSISAVGVDVRMDRFTARTPKGNRKFINLEVEFSSKPDGEWVVLVSHYDTKPGVKCPGANDGASTAGLLTAICNALVDWRTVRGNILLIWTDGEECMDHYTPDDGFWGSRHAAQKLKEEGRRVKAVICLDMLGDRDLSISLPRNTSPALRRIARFAAKKAGMPGLVMESDELVRDDHVPFIEAGFKAVDLIDFNYGSAPGKNDYWHTEKDTVDKISADSLLKAGRIVVEMLNVLLT